MPGLNIGTVVGTDGVAIVYNPDQRWQEWNIDEIYMGLTGLGKYIPKVKDIVNDIQGSRIIRKIVTEIHPTTLIPTLVDEDLTPTTPDLTPDQVLLGINGQSQNKTFRVYLDNSVTPHRLTVDSRMTANGSMNTSAKVFLGSDTTAATGVVISRMYDNTGALISENIPLELVATGGINNIAIKAIVPFYTNYDLPTGELVTAVFYDDAGFVTYFEQLTIEQTAFIRSTDKHQEAVISIKLESPFITDSNSRLISIPSGTTIDSLNLVGVVTYSSGREQKYPVDGTKFVIFGLDSYVASSPGYIADVLVKYTLDNNEVNYSSTNGAVRFISEIYRVQTVSSNTVYNLKLFIYPYWVSNIVGYQLKWYLYNLSRNIFFDATASVIINPANSVFNPNLYGTLQRLNVSVNARDVDASFSNFNHVQTVDIVLSKTGLERVNNWSVGYSPTQVPRYGIDTNATAENIATNTWHVDVSTGANTQAAWLEKLYFRTQPLFDPNVESGPMTPNFFRVIIDGITNEYPLSQWNSKLTFVGAIRNNTTAYVQFIKRTPDNDFELAIAGLPLYYVNNVGAFL